MASLNKSVFIASLGLPLSKQTYNWPNCASINFSHPVVLSVTGGAVYFVFDVSMFSFFSNMICSCCSVLRRSCCGSKN